MIVCAGDNDEREEVKMPKKEIKSLSVVGS